jgi:hypothetical protein
MRGRDGATFHVDHNLLKSGGSIVSLASYVEEIEDPTDGTAVNLFQGESGLCVCYAMGACIYEQVFALY